MRFPELIRAWRHHEEISIREAAGRIGIKPATLVRVESGRAVSGETVTAILNWMLKEG